MFMKWREAMDKGLAARHAARLGFTVEGEGWDVREDGLELAATAEPTADDTITTQTRVTVNRGVLAVSLNPAVAERLGYTPACPQYLYPGHWGPVTISGQGVWEAAADLPWLVRLHFIPVTTLD